MFVIGGACGTATAASATQLSYHNGPVLTHPSTTSFIYWQGSSGVLPANYIPTLAQFIVDWSGSPEHGVLTGYFQNEKQRKYVSNTIRYGGMTTDTNVFPGQPLTRSQVAYEVRKVVHDRGLSEGYSSNYAVLLPEGVKVKDAADDCAWHDWVADRVTSRKVFYSIIPYYSQGTKRCSLPGGAFPNGADIDNAIDMLSHELSEIATNPWHSHPTTLASWYDTRSGQEIGDLCRMAYTSRDHSTGADVILGGHPYLIQGEWSNRRGGCSLSSVPLPGGAGSISDRGRIGTLRIDKSSRRDVIDFAGSPDDERPGTFYAPGYPTYEALGYRCGGKRTDTSGLTYYHGPWCRTVFYLNKRTRRLAAFFTGSSAYAVRADVYPRLDATTAEQRLRRQATGGGCGYGGFSMGNHHSPARLHVNVDGGQLVSVDPRKPYRLVGGQIGSFSMETKRHPVGMFFC